VARSRTESRTPATSLDRRAPSPPPDRARAASGVTEERDALRRAEFGVCVCGGRSRRMGRDKAALVVGDRTLLARATETLAQVADEVVLATGAGARYAELGLRVVLDRCADAGPLAGLEAGLSAAAENATGDGALVAVLPCDMPRAGATLFRELVRRARLDPDAAAHLFAGPAGAEPLCGVYHTRALVSIRAALDAGERKVTSFRHRRDARGRLPRVVLVQPSDLAGAFGADDPTVNLNTPEDLAAERVRRADSERA